jgi:hypothetical protein
MSPALSTRETKPPKAVSRARRIVTITTTLYDLVSALREGVPLHAEDVVVALVAHWLRTGRLRALREVQPSCAIYHKDSGGITHKKNSQGARENRQER